MEASPVAAPRPVADPYSAATTRLVHRAREARLAGERAAAGPRAEIDASWNRALRSGVDPEQSAESRWQIWKVSAIIIKNSP